MKNMPAQGSKRRLAFILFLIIWLLKLVFGLIDVTRRHVPDYPGAVRGFPDIGQMELHVVIPATFVVLNLLILAFASKLPKWLAIVATALQVFLLLVLLFFSTGGI